jgi:hypothetical protein
MPPLNGQVANVWRRLESMNEIDTLSETARSRKRLEKQLI